MGSISNLNKKYNNNKKIDKKNNNEKEIKQNET